jgi:LmbE family N-acetylglucosaminyl deacetylase
MAVDGILQCFQKPDKWFCGVVVTDGRSSPRSGVYANMDDEAMMKVRYEEQKHAAYIGQYGSQILMGFPSNTVRDATNKMVVEDLVKILNRTQPDVVYTHNLADKHPTHIAVVFRTIQALRQMDRDALPNNVYGCEAWRDLDWLPDSLKTCFDCSDKTDLQEALLSVFDSQISAGKRYDLAAMGRRLAHATFFQSHATDTFSHLSFAMDLTPLVVDPNLDIEGFTRALMHQFEQDVISTFRAAS